MRHNRLFVVIVKQGRAAVLVEAAQVGARRADAAPIAERRAGGRGRVVALMARIVVGEVAGEEAHKGVEGTRAEELQGVGPLSGADELGAGDDLDCSEVKRRVELLQALFLAIAHETVEFVGGIGETGDFVDIVVEGVGVLDARRDGVVLVLQLGGEIISLHPKLPERP